MVVLDSGRLLAFGHGLDTPQFRFWPGIQLGEPERVVTTASGQFFTIALTAEGQAFVLGSVHGKLSRHFGRYPKTTSRKVTFLSPEGHAQSVVVSAIAAGDRHALFLTSDGRVFSMGSNRHGQLGRVIPKKIVNIDELGAVALDYNEGDVARRVEGLPEGVVVKAVAAGSAHSLALADDGRLYAFGSNRDGQCGVTFGDNPPSERHYKRLAFPAEVALPQLLTSLLPVKGIAAGGSRTYAFL